MPRTRETGVTEARHALAELVNGVAYQSERILLKRHGKARAAMIPMEDFRLLEALESELDLRALRAAFADQRNARPIDWDQVKTELGLLKKRSEPDDSTSGRAAPGSASRPASTPR
jgi:PHD/YefM family antitoxin component YafN of YafNO toxin-antitoxin module